MSGVEKRRWGIQVTNVTVVQLDFMYLSICSACNGVQLHNFKMNALAMCASALSHRMQTFHSTSRRRTP